MRPEQISRYETGRKVPLPDTLRRLGECLGVSPAWLQYGADQTQDPGPSRTPQALKTFMAGPEWAHLPEPVRAAVERFDWGGREPTELALHYLAQAILAAK